MGGWISLIGDSPDFDDRLANFKKVFSVAGVPNLRIEEHHHNKHARTIAWAWTHHFIPDVYVKETEEGDTVVVPGKVLSNGEINKKIRIVALSFSKEAEEKLGKKKCEVVSILEEIKVNPKAEGIKILK